MKTKISHLWSWQRCLAFAGLACLISMSLVRQSHAQTFSQAYGSDAPLQRGMIVQLKKSDTTKIEPVSHDMADQMHGILIGANDAAVTLGNTGQQNYVATTGHYAVLVSTQNGKINPGDYVTISALKGIGMKSSSKDEYVVGRALEGFDGKSSVVNTAQIEDSQKHKQSVNISRIQVDIVVSRNPLLKAEKPNVPEFLKRAAEATAGKPVSTVRIYTSVLVFLVSAAIALCLMYGGIRSGIISIGRNPLSKKMVIRGMLQVVLTGLIIFITGIFGVYLLLKI